MPKAVTPAIPSARILPRKFILTVEEHEGRGWMVTSDAHPEFLHLVFKEQGLADGLREVPLQLRLLLIAQMQEVSRKKAESTASNAT